jgi:hypothetical protein
MPFFNLGTKSKGHFRMKQTIMFSLLAVAFLYTPSMAKALTSEVQAESSVEMAPDKYCCKVGVKVKCGDPTDATPTDLGEGEEKCLKQEKDARKNREDDALNRAQTHCNGRPVISQEYAPNCRFVPGASSIELEKGAASIAEW